MACRQRSRCPAGSLGRVPQIRSARYDNVFLAGISGVAGRCMWTQPHACGYLEWEGAACESFHPAPVILWSNMAAPGHLSVHSPIHSHPSNDRTDRRDVRALEGMYCLLRSAYSRAAWTDSSTACPFDSCGRRHRRACRVTECASIIGDSSLGPGRDQHQQGGRRVASRSAVYSRHARCLWPLLLKRGEFGPSRQRERSPDSPPPWHLLLFLPGLPAGLGDHVEGLSRYVN